MHEAIPPSLSQIEATADLIAPYINVTPIHLWRGREIEAALAGGTDVVVKLELFQRSGAFKARGALTNLLRLDDAQRSRGVTAVSAGNHAIAVAFAARALNVDAKVVMLSTANPARVAAAEAFGAKVVMGGDGPSSFALAEAVAREEGRAFIHPFEGEGVALGAGTLGLEFVRQAKRFDAVIIPIGGGGLAAGVGSAVRALLPDCLIYGVEPEGANSMGLSFAAGKPVTLERVSTIADSLAPPMALPYSFGLCRRAINEIVTVSDDEIARAAALLFRELKLAVEPAAAAATAGLLGPLKTKLAGKRVGIIICGANIDPESHAALMRRGNVR